MDSLVTDKYYNGLWPATPDQWYDSTSSELRKILSQLSSRREWGRTSEWIPIKRVNLLLMTHIVHQRFYISKRTTIYGTTDAKIILSGLCKEAGSSIRLIFSISFCDNAPTYRSNLSLIHSTIPLKACTSSPISFL